MKAYVITLWLAIAALCGGTTAQFHYERQQRELTAVDIKRLDQRIEHLEGRPIIFNAALKVGDEVVLFDKQARAKVLAIDGRKVWAAFAGRGPMTLNVDEVALVQEVKDQP